MPEPRRSPALGSRGHRGPLVFAVVATVVVLAFLLPVLLLGPEIGPVGGQGGEVVTPTLTTTTTTLPTTTSTTDVVVGTAPPESPTVGDLQAGSYRFLLVPEIVDTAELPTATLILRAVDAGARPVAEAVVGEAGGFFWNVISAEQGICGFSVTPTEEGRIRIVVQVLFSPSIGCSPIYVFEFADGVIQPADPAPQDVAQAFFAAWQSGIDLVVTGLATDEVAAQVESVRVETDWTFSACEGAAGSVYCSWLGNDGGSLVIRVQNTDPPLVDEMRIEGYG